MLPFLQPIVSNEFQPAVRAPYDGLFFTGCSWIDPRNHPAHIELEFVAAGRCEHDNVWIRLAYLCLPLPAIRISLQADRLISAEAQPDPASVPRTSMRRCHRQTPTSCPSYGRRQSKFIPVLTWPSCREDVRRPCAVWWRCGSSHCWCSRVRAGTS